MIKLVVFDLDGVLIDSKDMHYDTLNDALRVVAPSFIISRKDHIEAYDGLPTASKLKMLGTKGLDCNLFDKIKVLKQRYTVDYINNNVHKDDKLINIFRFLKSNGYLINVASNAVRETIVTTLNNKGVFEYVDHIVSNQDVKHSKPNPEMYLRCILNAGVSPCETVIVEDSPVGRQAAINSGSHLIPVNSSSDLTMEMISDRIKMLNNFSDGIKWIDNKLNVLIPMAGAGSRFSKAGYTFPKPLIPVFNKPMIQVVVESLMIEANYIYIVQREHCDKYNLVNMLNLITPGCKVVQIDGVTEGACCTTLLAENEIDNNNQLFIVNSDQYIEWNSSEFMYSMVNSSADGGILTFGSTHPKWSFARVDQNNIVAEVQEKNPISNEATVGAYYWKRGSDYVKYAKEMISNNMRVNNEFYVCPVYNLAINDNKIIKAHRVSKMLGLGTPEDLDVFIRTYSDEVNKR